MPLDTGESRGVNANRNGYWVYRCTPNADRNAPAAQEGDGYIMATTLRELTRWSDEPAKDVDTTTTPKVNMLRGLAARATTPLLPDDYLKLLNPLWSARELRGEVVEVRGRPRTRPR